LSRGQVSKQALRGFEWVVCGLIERQVVVTTRRSQTIRNHKTHNHKTESNDP